MPDSATSGVPNTTPDAPPAPREYTPDGAGTLAILCARQLDTLSEDPQMRLSQIAWIWARRVASVPNGAKKHEAHEIYEQLNIKATGDPDDDDDEDRGERPSEGNMFWWNHWENCFEREPWAHRPKDGWNIYNIYNATRDDDEIMHGAQLTFEYNDSVVQAKVGNNYPHFLEHVLWSKYDCHVHVATLELRSFREHCYLFQREGVQYLALNSEWRRSWLKPEDEGYHVTPRPNISLVRFPAPGVFECANMETGTNQVALTVVDTTRLQFKVLRYTAQVPSVECPTMDDLADGLYRKALLAGGDWEDQLKLVELLAAYKSMFEGPARDNAKPTTEGLLMSHALRGRARAVLLRWINGFLRRKARRQLAAAASAAGLKRKREDAATAAAPAGDDYGFAF